VYNKLHFLRRITKTRSKIRSKASKFCLKPYRNKKLTCDKQVVGACTLDCGFDSAQMAAVGVIASLKKHEKVSICTPGTSIAVVI